MVITTYVFAYRKYYYHCYYSPLPTLIVHLLLFLFLLLQSCLRSEADPSLTCWFLRSLQGNGLL